MIFRANEARAEYRDAYREGRQPHAQALREGHNAIFGYIIRRARPGNQPSDRSRGNNLPTLPMRFDKWPKNFNAPDH